jgi:hypothetical protein
MKFMKTDNRKFDSVFETAAFLVKPKCLNKISFLYVGMRSCHFIRASRCIVMMYDRGG